MVRQPWWGLLLTLVPVTAVLSAQLAVTPNALAFSGVQGGPNPPSQTASLGGISASTNWSSCIDPLGSGSWLSISPVSGAGPATITVSVNLAGVPAGLPHQIVYFNTGPSSCASGVPMHVFLTVTAAVPVLRVGSFGLVFSAQSGAANPAPQNVSITNAGSGAMNWSAVATASWVTLSPASGTAPSTLAVGADTSGLSPGTHSANVTVTAPGATDSPKTFPVTLNLAPPPSTIALSPASLSFSFQQGCGTPSARTVAITNTGGGTLSWTAEASTTSGGAWLTVAPAAGSGNSGNLIVAVNPAGLSPGTYTGKVTINAGGATNSPQEIPVTFSLQARSALTVTPAALSFRAPPGGALAPQSFQVAGLGDCPAGWTAAITAITPAGGSWLTLSPTRSTASGPLTVAVNSADLAAGDYAATIAVSSPGAANSPQSVQVNLSLAPAGSAVIALSPASLAFSLAVGGPAAAQTFEVKNSGTGALGWTAQAATQTGGAWLAVTPATGTAPATLTVRANPAGLASGAYSGLIAIAATAASNAANSPQQIPVTLLVGAPLAGENGVVNGASFSTDAVVCAGAIASLFGVRLAGETRGATELPLPTTLAGVQVLVNDKAAPLFFVSPGQINFQMPADAAGSTIPVAVSSGGLQGLAIAVKLAPESPGIFSAAPGGQGQGAVLNQDFSANSAANPALAGSVLQIFATGLGATNPVLAAGQPGATAPPFHATVQTPVVTIGGIQADVLFSAIAPGFAGLYQVNARLPAAAATGAAVPLQITIGGRSSNTVTVAVR